MTRSASVDFTQNRDEAIQQAFELIGIAQDGEALQASDINVANRALNVMLKAWQAYDLHLWKRENFSLTLVASQGSYTFGRSGSPDVIRDRPLRVLQVVRKDSSSNQVPLTRMTKDEYYTLGNRTTTGTPVNYHFDPTLDNSTMYVWPVPDTTAATDYTLELVVQSPLEDMDDSLDDFDFPVEWLEAIIYNLAVRLIPRYGSMTPTETSQLRRDADKALELVLGFDVEQGSLYIQPDMRRI